VATEHAFLIKQPTYTGCRRRCRDANGVIYNTTPIAFCGRRIMSSRNEAQHGNRKAELNKAKSPGSAQSRGIFVANLKDDLAVKLVTPRWLESEEE
jgi:hypothetical protein